MGSIRKNPSGHGWQVRYRDSSGRQRTQLAMSKAQANSALRSIETEIERKTWIDPANGKLRFEEYAKAWRESVAHLRPGSLANLDSRLARHVYPGFGDRKLGEIQPVDVRSWVSYLVAGGLSPSTVKATYQVFARIMATAVIDGLIARSPCIGIRLPRNGCRQEMHFLSTDQIRELAAALEPRYRAVVYMAAYTGMRWGELAGLKAARCDLLRGTVDIVEALTEINGHVAVGPTKNGKARTISLPRFLCSLLNDHITTFGTPGGYVFTSAEGMPLRRNFYVRHYKPAVKRTGLPPALRFHDLRHTCVALLIAQDAHPKAIQERLGHSTIKLTFDRYGHLFPSLDDRLRDGLERAWQESAPTADGTVAVIDAGAG